jgi:hypothetical protein
LVAEDGDDMAGTRPMIVANAAVPHKPPASSRGRPNGLPKGTPVILLDH